MSTFENLHGVYNSIWESGKVPARWKSTRRGIKVNIKRNEIMQLLRHKIQGSWKKVYRYGIDGSEVHYIEHVASGKVWRVRYYPPEEMKK